MFQASRSVEKLCIENQETLLLNYGTLAMSQSPEALVVLARKWE